MKQLGQNVADQEDAQDDPRQTKHPLMRNRFEGFGQTFGLYTLGMSFRKNRYKPPILAASESKSGNHVNRITEKSDVEKVCRDDVYQVAYD